MYNFKTIYLAMVLKIYEKVFVMLLTSSVNLHIWDICGFWEVENFVAIVNGIRTFGAPETNKTTK